MATPHSMQQPVYCELIANSIGRHSRFFYSSICISGIRISKILLGRTQTPSWASQLRCSQGRAPHDMVCPPKPKILATPLHWTTATARHI